jgi:outer membrane immunogenic protein
MKARALVSIAMIAAAAGSVSAADLPVKAPPLTAAAVNWAGFYAGGNIGYGWGRTGGDLIGNTTGLDIPTAIAGGTIPSTYGLRERGVLGGIQAGRNWQAGNWVWGLEADLQLAGVRQEVAFAHPAVVVPPRLFATESAGSANLDWFGTVRGRLGFVWQQAMIYGIGGLVYGQTAVSISNHVVPPPPSGSFSESSVRIGWTIGAGAEWAFANAWSFKAEYLHIDLGTSTGQTHPGPVDFLDYRFHHDYEIARVGFNYHWGVDPIVARY